MAARLDGTLSARRVRPRMGRPWEVFPMRSVGCSVWLVGAFLVATCGGGPASAHVGEVRALFNGKDLSGWRVFVDPRADRYSPESSPEGIFEVEDGLIHVSGERFACLSTEEEFDNYRLVVEFRWGERRWAPRAEA